jgi:hypothetical protein
MATEDTASDRFGMIDKRDTAPRRTAHVRLTAHRQVATWTGIAMARHERKEKKKKEQEME